VTAQELIKMVGGFEGYRVGSVGLGSGESSAEVWIELRAVAQAGTCSACGSLCERAHDVEERWVRELPVFGRLTRLLVHRRRLWCVACGGPKVERLSWLEPWARHTTRFAASVARLCKVATHKHVAQEYGIDRKTVKAIDKRYLEQHLAAPRLEDVTELAMDEFAIEKGHRYATVFIEPHRKEVLWVGRGRGREDIRPFFEMLGEQGRKRIRAVAMDMNGAFEKEVRAQCPQAQIVYDLFHVVAKYAREVLTPVRSQEAKRLARDAPARKVIKGSHWLLLRNKKNLQHDERVRLAELLAANRRIALIHVLKEDIKQLWRYRYRGAAQRFFDQWYHRAIRSRIEPLKKFARNLKTYLPGILSHCKHPLHTSVLEGINNKIKVIKRMAYGYRDDQYFFLKIRQAFPGIGT
jgi:transposase